jgi:hypothetical protein
MSSPTTYFTVLDDARRAFRDSIEGVEDLSEDSIREWRDEAISSAMPQHNAVIAGILLDRLELGFPDDKVAMEQGDIFAAIRESIREDLISDMHSEVEAAIEALETTNDED